MRGDGRAERGACPGVDCEGGVRLGGKLAVELVGGLE